MRRKYCAILAATVGHFGSQAQRALIFFHRWMGVALCLLFFLWFSSGIGMIYWEYPLISPADRLSHAEVLKISMIHLSPAEAYAQLGTDVPPPAEARLAMFDGRPAYKFGTGADQLIVYADTGEMQTEFPAEVTRRIASAWSGQSVALPQEQEDAPVDQWTVSEEFAALRPLRKYTWPDGEQIYVSTQNGEVAQDTTRKSRLGAYLGPIPHWLYFTPLRRHGPQWARVVIWTSGLATALAMIGIAVGLSIYSPGKKFQYRGAPSALPYTRWKRWHSTLGLTFGVFACTWAFSGMLSMDPFPAWQGERNNPIQERFDRSLRGRALNLANFDSKPPQQALREAGGGINQLELTSFLGEPVYVASRLDNQTKVIPVHERVASAFDTGKIVAALADAAAPYAVSQVRIVTRYEAYYLDRFHRLPLPVVYAELNDQEHSGFYIDPKTARIVQNYDSRSRRNRWLYHGLHSWDLPVLYAHRPLRDAVLLVLMLAGSSLSITSIVLACKVLRRKIHPKGSSDSTKKTVPAAL